MNGGESSEPIPGASCAAHASAPAVRVCDRCGAFMCAACVGEGDGSHCPACLERLGADAFPLSRDAWTLGALMDHVWEAWKREWLMLSVAVLVLLGVVYAVAFAGQLIQMAVVGGGSALAQGDDTAAAGLLGLTVGLNLFFSLVQSLVSGLLMLGFNRMAYDVLMGRAAELGRLFSQFRKFPTLLLQQLILWGLILVPIGLLAGILFAAGAFAGSGADEDAVAIGVLVAVLVLAVPLVWYVLGFFFAGYELAYDDEVGAWESIVRGWRLVSGARLATFGVMILAGLLGFLGILACCIGIIPSLSLAYVLLAGLFLTLRRGSGLPPPVRRA